MYFISNQIKMVSRAELMKEAKDLGIKGRSKMKKAELEEAIRRVKEMSEEKTESVKTPDPPKKVGRGRPKKESAPPPMKKEEKKPMRRSIPEPPPKQLEAKKTEMMKEKSSGKRGRGY